MPKRKKYPKLPSGYGSIRYLGAGRSCPYAVHPPAYRNDQGLYRLSKPLCYVPDWYTGFAVLTAYHAGTYTPGLETIMYMEASKSAIDLDDFCRRLIRDHAVINRTEDGGLTLAEVYEQWSQWKYGENAAKTLSKSSKAVMRAAYAYFSPLHNKPITKITLEELQQCIIDCPKKKTTKESMASLAKQLWKYAIPRHLCTENPAQYVIVPAGGENEHGVPFYDDDLRKLWAHKGDPVVEMILIMCYSGFRISAYLDMETNLKDMYFKGGIKTTAGKGRVVPIHSGIADLVRHQIDVYGRLLLGKTDQAFRKLFREKLAELGLSGDPEHTPHDCRHTFSRLCEKYGVSEADRKRMLGHSFGADITNRIYGHRTIDELRGEIEKIEIPPCNTV